MNGAHFIWILLSSLLIGLAGCGRNERTFVHNEVIRQSGTYVSKEKDLQIDVWMDDLIVRYRVMKSGRIIIESFDRPSSTQRWFLVWDTNNQLWFDSSDIGGMLWRPDPASGEYSAIRITEDQHLIKSMPRPVFEALPKSLQEDWQHFRK